MWLTSRIPGQGHLQGARNWRRRQREDIDADLELAKLILGRHPETLLLIDNDQSEALPADILGEQAVGADDDINLAGGETSDDLVLLAIGEEAREHFDPYRDRARSDPRRPGDAAGQAGWWDKEPPPAFQRQRP